MHKSIPQDAPAAMKSSQRRLILSQSSTRIGDWLLKGDMSVGISRQVVQRALSEEGTALPSQPGLNGSGQPHKVVIVGM